MIATTAWLVLRETARDGPDGPSSYPGPCFQQVRTADAITAVTGFARNRRPPSG
jgi:hypothetical protein